MEVKNIFRMEGMFLVLMFLQFASLFIWIFYLVSGFLEKFTALSNNLIFIGVVLSIDFFVCCLIFISFLGIYFKVEKKSWFWVSYVSFTAIIAAASFRLYMASSLLKNG